MFKAIRRRKYVRQGHTLMFDNDTVRVDRVINPALGPWKVYVKNDEGRFIQVGDTYPSEEDAIKAAKRV